MQKQRKKTQKERKKKKKEKKKKKSWRSEKVFIREEGKTRDNTREEGKTRDSRGSRRDLGLCRRPGSGPAWVLS